jgi:hypothetical protein
MATEDKKTKADAAPKTEAPAKDKSEAPAKDKSSESGSKTDGGDKAAAASAKYSRGEGQKPVTAAYKENWNAIFAKKKPKRGKR